MEKTSGRPDWLERLIAEIEREAERSKRSYRSMSIAAGFGANYIQQLISNPRRSPGFDEVVRLCEMLNVSITYIVTGADISHEDEKFLGRFRSLSDEQRRRFLGLLESFVSHDPSDRE